MARPQSWTRPPSSPRRPRRLPYRADRFRQIMENERQRTDRSGLGFSLVVFDMKDVPHGSLVWGVLFEIMNRRTRTTDEIGWLHDGRVAVLLPYTPTSGADVVIRNITKDFTADMPAANPTIYAYPFKEGDGTESVDSLMVMPEPGTIVEPLETMFALPHPWWKRTIDILGALAGLAIAAPFLLVAAILIRLTSKGPIVFRQLRAGHGGAPFTIFKLRTMVVDAEEQKAALKKLNEQDGPAFKIARDPRITTVGRILRKTSIDELPQLWNVLIGDMSLVGPRPLPIDEAYRCTGWQQRRLLVKPGLTCIWQVEGRSRVTFAEWARMDIRYMRGRTLLRDFIIMLKTLPAVIFQKGAR